VPDWEKVPQGPYVVIHPTSRWRFKCWPAEKMREIAKKLIERGVKVVVTAGPGEDVEAIVKDLPVLNFCGALQLKEFAALIRSSACLLCVDSLPFHIASALKKPVVALFGPTSEITWGPWRNPEAVVLTENFSCRPCYQDGCGGSKKSDCLEQISVERVWSALEAKIFPKIGAARLGILDETFGCSR
jgi:heptosyltransferase-3